MAIRPIFSATDKASAIATVAGTALSADLCTQAFPESANKRQFFNWRPATVPVGATPIEAFIDGLPNFRFRIADRSTCVLKILASYNSTVTANATAIELTVGVQNINGVITLLGTQLQVKYPGASTVNLAATVDTPSQAIVLTCTGVAGDLGQQWDIRSIGISEVTDLG